MHGVRQDGASFDALACKCIELCDRCESTVVDRDIDERMRHVHAPYLDLVQDLFQCVDYLFIDPKDYLSGVILRVSA